MEIRDARADEAGEIAALVTAAFAGVPYSDGSEAALLARLDRAGGLVLSLVAARPEGGLLGQVAASEALLDGRRGWAGIGPVSVRPDQQGEGIGSALMEAALQRLARAGFKGAVLLGEPGYYRRFGFATGTGLSSPGLPESHLLGLGFAGAVPRGVIRWHPAFGL